MKRGATLEQIDASIERCQKRVFRLVNLIKDLQGSRKRLLRKQVVPQPPPLVTVSSSGVASIPADQFNKTVAIPVPVSDPLDIPTDLQRVADSKARDKAAADAILAEQAERKKNKTRVRIEEMKAKQVGKTKQMPLQGKDALKAIFG